MLISMVCSVFILPTALSVAFGASSPKGRAKWLELTCKVLDKLKYIGLIRNQYTPLAPPPGELALSPCDND